MEKLNNRYVIVFSFIVIAIIIFTLTRLGFLLSELSNAALSPIKLLRLLTTGLFYDVATSFYAAIPLITLVVLSPRRFLGSKFGRAIVNAVYACSIFSLIFNLVAEIIFWAEFGKRFDFVAVDYLLYTHEVLHNILESYPVPLLLSIMAGSSIVICILMWNKVPLYRSAFSCQLTASSRLLIGAFMVLIPVGIYFGVNKQGFAESATNVYNRELAKNGMYSFFSNYRNNTMNYERYFLTKDAHKIQAELNKIIPGVTTTLPANKMLSTEHFVDNTISPYAEPNIVLIMVESLSASYMGIFGNHAGLTPYLDELTSQSLFFNNFYATGTRTIRGMEAVTLSIPPTPGRSILKRPNNENLFSAGFIFKQHNYSNSFIYSGYGYFDNMNYFFNNNGWESIDRASFSNEEETFGNAWGVCDEDLFAKVLTVSDEKWESKQPFFHFVMTTSNHRPFTYPDDKIDIPSATGRNGAVKYTDYAIHNFIESAKLTPWFNDTIFVILADHNGSSAGKTDLPLERYKIPLIIYSPSKIKPETINTLSSQIDLMPTLFAMLGWSYSSKFYGQNILSSNFKPRALIGNYQKLGLYEDSVLTVLSPNKTIDKYHVSSRYDDKFDYFRVPILENEGDDIVAYYQSAAFQFDNNLYKWEE